MRKKNIQKNYKQKRSNTMTQKIIIQNKIIK